MILIPLFGTLVAIAGLIVSILELRSGNRRNGIVWATVLSGVAVGFTILIVAVGVAT